MYLISRRRCARTHRRVYFYTQMRGIDDAAWHFSVYKKEGSREELSFPKPFLKFGQRFEET